MSIFPRKSNSNCCHNTFLLNFKLCLSREEFSVSGPFRKLVPIKTEVKMTIGRILGRQSASPGLQAFTACWWLSEDIGGSTPEQVHGQWESIHTGRRCPLSTMLPDWPPCQSQLKVQFSRGSQVTSKHQLASRSNSSRQENRL